MPLRIFFKSWRIAFRTKKRFIAFTVMYSILLFLIAQVVRTWIFNFSIDPFSPLTVNAMGNFLYALVGGAVMGLSFAWILAHGRRDDISILKCIGWGNHNIRELVLGEIIFVTCSALAALTLIAIGMSGIWYTTFAGVIQPVPPTDLFEGYVTAHPWLTFWVVSPREMWIAFGTVMASQIPGILLLMWRVLRISPMRALRRTE